MHASQSHPQSAHSAAQPLSHLTHWLRRWTKPPAAIEPAVVIPDRLSPTPPAIVWLTDGDLCLTEVRGLVDDFPLTQAEVINALLADATHRQHLTATLRGSTTRFLYHHQERVYLQYLQPRRTGDGQIIGCRGVTLDISATDEGSVGLCGDEVEASRIRMLGEFLNNASHDLRTPLSIMHTSLYLLKRNTDPAKSAERLEVLGRTVKRLEHILDEMFIMARLDALPLYATTRFDLVTLLTELAGAVQKQATERGILFGFLLPTALPGFQGHPNELEQAIEHVLRNALQHTPAGGHIDLRVWEDKHIVQVEIRDSGSGISPEDLPRIFERFFRSEKHRPINDDRVGLGLSIAQKVFERHGGSITVKSQPGEGSRFLITLPYSPI